MIDQLEKQARGILDAAIEAVKPAVLIRRRVRLDQSALRVDDFSFDLSGVEKVFIIGFGKASALMAREMEEILGPWLFYGVVSVKYGYHAACRKVRVLEAGHPIIDENSLSASRQILQVAAGAGRRDLVICLISGGGSALLESLPEGIGLQDLQRVFTALLGCGATIEEVNAVRKHLSKVKGGQLARAIAPATCLSLIISDVIGDPLDAIASGPTAPDPTSFADAWGVIEKYQLQPQLPPPVVRYLRQGLAGKVPDTVKAGDPLLGRVHNFILGNNLAAIQVVEQQAKQLGYRTLVLSSRIQGEAREVARVLAGIVQEIGERGVPVSPPACLIAGGETTVTLRGKGKGGRNQELALAFLSAMRSYPRQYVMVSCGSDGTDGPTDAAGGMVHPAMWENIAALDLNPEKYLRNNDSYSFLEKVDGLLKTGPTGTNVMDLIFVLIPR